MNKSINKRAIHLHFSTFENESRILKETKSLIDNEVVSKIKILAIGIDGLEGVEQIDKNRKIIRIRSKYFNDGNLSSIYGLNFILKIIRKIELIMRLTNYVRIDKPNYINFHQVIQLPLIPFFKLASFNSKLIYDTHELETETNGLRGIKKTILKIIERIFIKTFKIVFVVSPSIEEWYRNKYKITNIFTVLNCPNYNKVSKSNLFRDEFKISNNSKIFLYQGALFEGRGIEIMLDAFSKITGSSTCVVFMGYGKLDSLILKYSSIHKNIFYKPAVAPDDLLRFTSSADFGISFIEDVSLSDRYCLPNKLFEYSMAELPVIVSNLKEMKAIVESNGIGIVSDRLTVESLLNTIKKIQDKDLMQYRENVEKFNEIYCWEYQEQIMINAYKEYS